MQPQVRRLFFDSSKFSDSLEKTQILTNVCLYENLANLLIGALKPNDAFYGLRYCIMCAALLH